MSLVALITGSSRGIGRAIAEELAAAGYAVVVNYRSQADAAAEVVRGIEQRGGRAIAVRANVALAEDRRRLLDAALAEFGRLDVLVNNAGITSPGRLDLLELTEASWDEVFATNLKAPFFLSQQAALIMREGIQRQVATEAVIVNVSSISAFAVSTDRADYCLAKAAQQMLTWLFATRLADDHFRVYEVCPGVVASDMTAPVQQKYDQLIADGLSPLRRWGQPADVARVVRSLLSPDFAFCTGDRIHVDGGFHIRRL